MASPNTVTMSDPVRIGCRAVNAASSAAIGSVMRGGRSGLGQRLRRRRIGAACRDQSLQL
jgi:hypothetical protein